MQAWNGVQAITKRRSLAGGFQRAIVQPRLGGGHPPVWDPGQVAVLDRR
jgi:hypothetical protein